MRYAWEQTGVEFEHELVAAIREYSEKRYGKCSIRNTTVEEDLHSGTDCEILKVRIDPTLRIAEKKRTWLSKFELALGLSTIKFGVRYGNGRCTFETPVLVIGVETVLDVRHYMVNIVDEIRAKLDDVLNMGMDIYNDRVFPEEAL